ncbi:universal stress protein [Sodalis ligni]|uniref:universal stress protein n=1 Tax=Sodalis ligni TaxID=2697027 RepID=UPI001BDE1179|nr:universal stress protein [Sodalis ligni]QWA11385.1 universal stress protein [Sodalis ligni]
MLQNRGGARCVSAAQLVCWGSMPVYPLADADGGIKAVSITAMKSREAAMTAIKQVLIAYDDSDCAKQALGFACEFVRRFDARLHIVSVCQLPQFGSGTATEMIIENARGIYGKFFDGLKDNPAYRDMDLVKQMEIGNPAEMILHYAESHKIDHIIVGHRGFSNIERWLMGSVARQIIDNAGCPVTVIRESSYSAQ